MKSGALAAPTPATSRGQGQGLWSRCGHAREPGLGHSGVKGLGKQGTAVGTPKKDSQAHLLATPPSLTTGRTLASCPGPWPGGHPWGRGAGLGGFLDGDEAFRPGSETRHPTRTRHPRGWAQLWRPPQSPTALTGSTLELGEDRLGLAVPLPTLLQGKVGHVSHQPPHPGPFLGPAPA